jgi:MYXO-CTERM domain-containing protein
LLVRNAFGLFVNSGQGMPNIPGNRDDPMWNAATRAFYFGSVTVEADAEGTTGLYFRTGSAGNIKQNSTPADIFYGDGGTSFPGLGGGSAGLGDVIAPDNALADAIINVGAGTGGDERGVSAFTGNPGDILGDNRLDVDMGGNVKTPGAPLGGSGDIVIMNHPGEPDDNLIVYFELSGAGDLQDLADRLLSGEGDPDDVLMDAGPITGSPFLPSANFFLKFNGGADGTGIPFAFSYAIGDDGQIDAYAVPEPTSFLLAGLAGLAMIGVGRRRRA